MQTTPLVSAKGKWRIALIVVLLVFIAFWAAIFAYHRIAKARCESDVAFLTPPWAEPHFWPRPDVWLGEVSHISPKSSNFRPSAALEALILRGVALADPFWADLGF